jgi:UDP-3-O-[3-hydroxymyristoyl] glucosamine N-acyltransferase
VGDKSITVNQFKDLSEARSGHLSFVSNQKFKPQLEKTQASAVILNEAMAKFSPVPVLIVSDPYLAYAKASMLLDSTPLVKAGVAESAIIHPQAKLAKTVSIAEGVIIGEGTVIADGVQIGAGTVIGQNCIIGKNTNIKGNVTLYHEVSIGENSLIHSGTVIGSDGFGFANEAGCWKKIAQLGKVVIGDQVEIGANCTIDRGALKNTEIGNGVKLDNMIHIAHNVIVGDHCAMAACVGIAGSTVIGERTTFSGAVAVVGHLDIPAGSHFTVRTVVNKSPKQAGVYSSGTGMMENKDWRKSVARFKQLDEMSKKIRQLEKTINQLKKQF